MRIYTRTGDDGETSTLGGRRVNKSSKIIRANGDIDELNSIMGLIIVNMKSCDVKEKILRIQSELIELGADISMGYVGDKKYTFGITKKNILRLEQEIDEWEMKLPELTKFILPGGSQSAAFTHLARSVARQVERNLVGISKSSDLKPELLQYANRLSDWLFVVARVINMRNNIEDIKFIS